ncbi:hypothetical protein [Streptomyces sp. NRRL WC-3742]|uniref:hypothetical protein n=1 Tax=Streptomyces sp. NRRL WC-3742 TaxID=1463934 RepID=UPI0004C85A4D|nr:hypothetical protein [Streptomyces sp. NRRL WC-3742]
MRRTAVPVSAFLLSLAVLTGCTSSDSGRTSAAGAASEAGGAPVDAAGAFDPEVALAQRTREPYSATVHLTVEESNGADRITDTVDGRLNFNTRTAGSETVRKTEGVVPGMSWQEEKTVDGVSYERPGGEGAWRRVEGDGVSGAAGQASAYAKAILGTGPAARRGMEKVGGVEVYHVAARLTAEQVRRVDGGNGARMAIEGATEADCHLWLDRLGRVVQGEQTVVLGNRTEVTKYRYMGFGPAETFTAPPVA